MEIKLLELERNSTYLNELFEQEKTKVNILIKYFLDFIFIEFKIK